MHTSRRVRIPVLLVTVALFAIGGCSSDRPSPEPSPEPAARYERVPHDLCRRLQEDQVAARFDLEVPAWYEPSTDYFAAPSWWSMSCRFPTQGGEERFTTVLGEMDPTCWVSVKVYRNLEGAPSQYTSTSGSFIRGHPDSVVTAVQGWWDQGTRVTTVEKIDQGTLAEDPRASDVQVHYFIQHHNLFLQASVTGWSPEYQAVHADDVLDDIMDVLIEEAVSHLRLREE